MLDESWLVLLFKSTPVLASFLGGILTFLSPCILPLLPAYFSYISGLSIQELKANNVARFMEVPAKCLAFIVGFSLVFILLGIFLDNTLGKIFNHPIMRYIAGGIICLFALHFMGILKIQMLDRTKGFNFESRSFLSPFLLGMSFSLGWSPCVGPILASILTLTMIDKNYSLYLILFFCLGLAIPFLITSFFINSGLKALKAISPHLGKIQVISGIFLLIVGVLIAFDGMATLTQWLISLMGN